MAWSVTKPGPTIGPLSSRVKGVTRDLIESLWKYTDLPIVFIVKRGFLNNSPRSRESLHNELQTYEFFFFFVLRDFFVIDNLFDYWLVVITSDVTKTTLSDLFR